jgi:hypothetical protein
MYGTRHECNGRVQATFFLPFKLENLLCLYFTAVSPASVLLGYRTFCLSTLFIPFFPLL